MTHGIHHFVELCKMSGTVSACPRYGGQILSASNRFYMFESPSSAVMPSICLSWTQLTWRNQISANAKDAETQCAFSTTNWIKSPPDCYKFHAVSIRCLSEAWACYFIPYWALAHSKRYYIVPWSKQNQRLRNSEKHTVLVWHASAGIWIKWQESSPLTLSSAD